jgi:glyoxylase I family protein
MDHVGFTVPDIAQAHDFFVGLLGCEHVHSVAVERWDDDWLRRHMNVGPGAEITAIRTYRCPSGSAFEVFEYAAAGQRLEQPRNSDVGGHHLAFRVVDMDAAVAFLRERGIAVLGEPSASGETGRWVYFLAPWGMQLELVSTAA